MTDEGKLGSGPEFTAHTARMEWRRPALRRLPIAATAHSGKVTIRGNDGEGGGKGDVGRVS